MSTSGLPGSRTFSIMVTGDTADEIEMAALDAARKFFGPDVLLSVDRSYEVTMMADSHPLVSSGKKYCASVVHVTAGSEDEL